MKYTVGLAFNAAHNQVLLQLKVKGPKYTIGYLNGPGGKHNHEALVHNAMCLPGTESPVGCMVREFYEETNLPSIKEDWLQFHYERHASGTELYFYTTDKLDIERALTTTAESLVIVSPGRDGWGSASHHRWLPHSDNISGGRASFDEVIRLQTSPRGGLIYNMPYLLPMAVAYLENPEHRYLEG